MKALFLTHHNLQGSQTLNPLAEYLHRFLTHHNLQGSQTSNCWIVVNNSFLPIIIYKVLKQG